MGNLKLNQRGRLFVDGVLVASSTTTGDAAGASGNGQINIGASNSGGTDSAPTAGASLFWAAIWQADLSYANFYPSYTPPVGTEYNLSAVWLLETDTTNYGLGV